MYILTSWVQIYGWQILNLFRWICEDVKRKKVMLCGKELKEGDGYTLEKEKLCLGKIHLVEGFGTGERFV